MKLYAHPEPEKALKHLINVWHRWEMQYERFYSLTQIVVAWFAHLHQVEFQPTLTNPGKRLWWYWCECEAICPSTTWEGTQTTHICMTWIWDAVWKVLQPQSKHSGMVCTLVSGRISANFPKSGDASGVVMMWVWSHMPIHILTRCSYTPYRNTMDMECIYSLNQRVVTWFAHLQKVGLLSANFHKSGEVSVLIMMWMWSHMPIHNLRRHSNISYRYAMDMGCSLKGSTDSTKA
jgi:hypothetical protein